MKGELTHRDETGPQGRHRAGKASATATPTRSRSDPDDFVWVDLGGVTLEVFFQPVPKPVFVPFGETIDFTALNIFLVMFFLGALFVISAMNRDVRATSTPTSSTATRRASPS